jgi:signal transduction histidine kinase
MKQWRVWLTFGCLMLLALTAMGLITRSTFVLESAQRAALSNALQARLEINNQQRVSNAARTIDRLMASLLATESLRPATSYQRLPLLNRSGEAPPEPVIWQANPFAQVYFQVDRTAQLRLIGTRPGEIDRMVALLADFNWESDLPGLLAAESVGWTAQPEEMYRVNSLFNRPKFDSDDRFPLPQKSSLSAELRGPPDRPDAGGGQSSVVPQAVSLLADGSEDYFTGPIYPIWFRENLLLVRKVTVAERMYLQGCLIDWPLLRRQMMRGIESGLPTGSIVQPVFLRPQELDGSYATWAPIRVITPAVELPDRDMPLQGGWLQLLVGWVFMVLAGVAIGMLLHTVVRESQRREAFVSAVTHELRTPLTAFRLYTDLLAKNPDPQKTRLYAKTLEAEAERLSHLVENVLTYSRLERRGITSHHRVVSVGTLLDAVVPRLDEHCVRNQMILDYLDASRTLREKEILTDPSAVERILFNLVDNACKYGKSNSESTIQLAIGSDEKRLTITVRDFGPGISAAQKRRLFQAYNHGQISTESPNKTIGLGLNISRQLAVALGGQLTFSDANPGAQFQLELPLEVPR